MRRLSESTAERLVDLIYACILGRTTWQAFLDELSAVLPGGKSVFFLHDAVRNRGGFSISSGLSEREVSEYGQHFSHKNPWMRKASIRPVGVGVVSDQMLDRSALVQSEYYNDFMGKIGCEAGVGVTIVREEGRSFMLSTMTRRVDPDENRPAAGLLTTLAPHLKRAFHLQQGKSTPDARNGGSAELLDDARIGLLLVGENCAAKTANKTMDAYILEEALLRLSRCGVVTLRDETANAILRQMTDRFGAGPRLHTYSVPMQAALYKVTVARLNRDAAGEFFEGPTTAILVESSAWMADAEMAGFAARHHLTPAELRLVAALDRGEPIREAAVRLRISEGTARQQLKSIFRKAGVSRQSELILRIHSSIAGNS